MSSVKKVTLQDKQEPLSLHVEFNKTMKFLVVEAVQHFFSVLFVYLQGLKPTFIQ